jgi:hypothetical protein
MTPASATSSATDFDFFFGHWSVQHRRLRQRLVGCTEWDAFTGTCRTQPMLDGAANVDDNWLDLPGGAYRALTLRSFDPTTRLWAIWWLDGRQPHQLDVPMRGSFADGVGLFLADEVIGGRAVRVRFLWSHITPQSCRWEQAFSVDGGETWEANWVMTMSRCD